MLSKDWDLKFLESVKSEMTNKSFTQADLVRMTGISKGTISMFLSGKSVLSFWSALRVASALHISLDRLYGLKIK